MYILWNNILLPLLLILAIIFVLTLIFVIFSMLESVVFSKIEELKIRRVMHNVVKDNCNSLRENINEIFDGMFEEFLLGKEAADKEFEKIKKSNKKKKGATNE